jgi:hypothetical protein
MADYDAVCWRRSELNSIASVSNVNGRGVPRSLDTELSQRELSLISPLSRMLEQGGEPPPQTPAGETTVRKVFTIGQTRTFVGSSMRLAGG